MKWEKLENRGSHNAIQNQVSLPDTPASHPEFNKIKTLKANYFMENAAMVKAPYSE